MQTEASLRAVEQLIKSVDQVAQGLAIHAADACRLGPVHPVEAASDNRRRLWLAFFVVAARRRSSLAEKSDLIGTAAGMAQLLPAPWNQLAHAQGIPRQSEWPSV
jgi:hypothetical protein